jgi:single-stranded DNA-binding protein
MAALTQFEGNLSKRDIFYKAGADDKKSFASFEIAQTSPVFKNGKVVKDDEGKTQMTEPTWYKVKAFGKAADAINENVKAGERVTVKGMIGEPEAYLTKEGTPAARNVIIANVVEPVDFTKHDAAITAELQRMKELGADEVMSEDSWADPKASEQTEDDWEDDMDDPEVDNPFRPAQASSSELTDYDVALPPAEEQRERAMVM